MANRNYKSKKRANQACRFVQRPHGPYFLGGLYQVPHKDLVRQLYTQRIRRNIRFEIARAGRLIKCSILLS